MTTTIAEITKHPAGTKFPSIQGRVLEVRPQRTVGQGKTVQDGIIQDGTGQIKFSAWETRDLSCYVGKEVTIDGGLKGSVVVKIDTYKGANTPTLSISSTCVWTVLASGGTAPVASPAASPAPAVAAPAVRGEKVGMAINNAVNFMTSAGEPFDAKRLATIASEIIKVSKWLEEGHLVGEKKAAPAADGSKTTFVPPTHTPDAANPEELDEWVPF